LSNEASAGRRRRQHALLGCAPSSANRSLIPSHRTTARGVLFLFLALSLLAGTAAARPDASKPIVFPVFGAARFTNDFGDARAGGRHQGIDIVAPKRALALAAEPGKVKFWTTSAAAGCMLYLYGASGTTYYYIHLNNDLTRKNDNKGKCVAGTAYAPGLKDGAKVAAGQPIGFVGDSGDANGIHAHLHFEVHPAGKGAVSPFPYLKAAQHLLFAAPAGTAFTLELDGKVVRSTDASLQVKLTEVRAWPMRQHQRRLSRSLLLNVSANAAVQSTSGAGSRTIPLTSAQKGQPVKVWTLPAKATLRAQRGDDLALEAALILLKPAP
jgi:hypothetical protein